MKNFQLSSFLFLLLVAVSCLGQEITVSDNLSGVFNKLITEKYRQALICNAFTTRFDILEEAAKQNTNVHVVCKKSSDKHYDKVRDKGKVIGYHAKMHDKLVLMFSYKRMWCAYVGSANFSDGHFKNTEVVLHIPDAAKMPGVLDHVEKLFSRATLFKSVTKKYDPRKPQLVQGPKTFSNKRRGSLTSEGLVSCFDFEKDSDYDLVAWMADRIKVDEKRCYYISSMNLDHPVFIDKIERAAKKGSRFSIIVDREERHLRTGHSIANLAQFAQDYPDNLALVWKKGQSDKSGIHHAKLFVRSPNSKGENGLTIVPTANFTKRGSREHNCAVVLPHASSDQKTIKNLNEKFDGWRGQAEKVPSVFVPRALPTELDTDKVASFVINGIVSSQPCAYYVMTGTWSNNRCTDSIRNALSSNSVFKIILLKNWIEHDTEMYKKLKTLASQNSAFIQIKSRNSDRENLTIGGRGIGDRHTVFLRYSPQCADLSYLLTSSGNLTYRAKVSAEDRSFTDRAFVLNAMRDLDRIWEEADSV